MNLSSFVLHQEHTVTAARPDVGDWETLAFPLWTFYGRWVPEPAGILFDSGVTADPVVPAGGAIPARFGASTS